MIASLKQDGVDDVVLEGHSQKAFDLEGAYRHVMVSSPILLLNTW